MALMLAPVHTSQLHPAHATADCCVQGFSPHASFLSPQRKGRKDFLELSCAFLSLGGQSRSSECSPRSLVNFQTQRHPVVSAACRTSWRDTPGQFWEHTQIHPPWRRLALGNYPLLLF